MTANCITLKASAFTTSTCRFCIPSSHNLHSHTAHPPSQRSPSGSPPTTESSCLSVDCDGGLDIVMLESESVCLWTMMVEGVYITREWTRLWVSRQRKSLLCANRQTHRVIRIPTVFVKCPNFSVTVQCAVCASFNYYESFS